MNSYFLARILLVGSIYVAVSATTTCELNKSLNGADSWQVIDGTTKSPANVLQITESFGTFNYALILKPKLTWLGSLQYCIARGGYLVDVTSKGEHEFVLKLAKKSNLLDKTSSVFWTGGSSIDMKNREFRWIVTNKTASKDFLDSSSDKKEKNCLSFNLLKTGKTKIDVLECWAVQPVICKSLLQ